MSLFQRSFIGQPLTAIPSAFVADDHHEPRASGHARVDEVAGRLPLSLLGEKSRAGPDCRPRLLDNFVHDLRRTLDPPDQPNALASPQ